MSLYLQFLDMICTFYSLLGFPFGKDRNDLFQSILNDHVLFPLDLDDETVDFIDSVSLDLLILTE